MAGGGWRQIKINNARLESQCISASVT